MIKEEYTGTSNKENQLRSITLIHVYEMKIELFQKIYNNKEKDDIKVLTEIPARLFNMLKRDKKKVLKRELWYREWLNMFSKLVQKHE